MKPSSLFLAGMLSLSIPEWIYEWYQGDYPFKEMNTMNELTLIATLSLAGIILAVVIIFFHWLDNRYIIMRQLRFDDVN